MDTHNDQHENGTNYPGSFLTGMLLGGLAGAVTMLLLAPQSGKRTRTQIQLKSIELRDQATEAMEDAMVQTRAKAHQITTGIRTQAEGLQHRGQVMIEEQKARVSAVIHAAGKQPDHSHSVA